LSSTDRGDVTSPAADPGSPTGPPTVGHGLRLTERTEPVATRLSVALFLSLLLHALLLSLTLSGDGFGLPGFGFPWQERRIEAPELRVGLVVAQAPAAPAAEAPALGPPAAIPRLPERVERPAAGGLSVVPFAPAAPAPVPAAEPVAPQADASRASDPVPAAATAAEAPVRTDRPGDRLSRHRHPGWWGCD